MVGTHARTLQLGNEGIYLVYPLVTPYGLLDSSVYVAVNFLSQLIFIFLLFWGMVMYAYEFETKEKQKLTKIKN